jgi:hypothetical protein
VTHKTIRPSSLFFASFTELRSAQILLCGGFFLLLNLFATLLASSFQSARPLANLDYLLVIGAFLFLRKRWVVWLLAGALLLDAVSTISPSYFLPGDQNLGLLWQALRHFPAVTLLVWFGGLMLVASILAWLFGRVAPVHWHRGSVLVSLLLAGIILFATDVLNGSSTLKVGTSANSLRIPYNIAFSPLERSALLLTQSGRSAAAIDRALTAAQSGTGRSLTGPLVHLTLPAPAAGRETPPLNLRDLRLRPAADRNLVLVVIESLASLQQDPRRTNLVGLLQCPGYAVTTDTVPFSGATVAGEARELLWKATTRLALVPESVNLPGRFAAAGYEISAFHGFFGSMFNRRNWYPGIGLTNGYFIEDLLQEEPDYHLQGLLFRGATDVDMAHHVRKTLETSVKRGKPAFVYWLTLSSHLPVDMPYARQLGWVRNAADPLPPEIQAHNVILAKCFAALAEVANSPGIGKTDWILVGDHTPPFDADTRHKHYLSGTVPCVVMKSLR